jgi:hypothetical protein
LTKVERRKIDEMNQFRFMEMSQGNSLCSSLKQTKMSFFSFTKSENGGRAVQSLPEEMVPMRGRRRWRKGMGG